MTVVKPVSSRDNPLLVRIRKLAADPAAYRKLAEVWLEGDHLCSAFVRQGRVPLHAVITEHAWEQAHLHELAHHAHSIAVVPQPLMKSLSTLESAPSIGFVVGWSAGKAATPGMPTVVLDRLQDAGNVGTILRSASAFGFAQIVAMKGTVAMWSPKVLRAGMGAHFGLQLVEGAESLDDLGIPLLVTSPHAALAIHEATLPWPCAWVMGNEGQGVSPALMQQATLTLRIAQPGKEESLNVAAAAAVCLHESLRRQLSFTAS